MINQMLACNVLGIAYAHIEQHAEYLHLAAEAQSTSVVLMLAADQLLRLPA